MDYVNLAVAALNEVSASTWIQWAQGSAVLCATLMLVGLMWAVQDLWKRVDWMWHDSVSRSEIQEIEERIGMLEMGLSQTRHKVDKHEEMLAHMQRMRDAKAAKKAKQVA